MAMVPHERSLVERLQDKPFVLLGVNEDDTRTALQQAVKEKDMPWRSIWDRGGAILRQWDSTGGLPFLALIDHQGKVRQTILGRPRDADLERAVEELVKEAAQAGGESSSS